MFGENSFAGSFWWVIPFAMFILCVFMMRGKKGGFICGFDSKKVGDRSVSHSDSAMDIIDKRYALGEIGDEEYQEKKRRLTQSN